MPTIELTEDQYDRIESLRDEMEQAQAGPYATVGLQAVMDYLLDLADAVEDPDRDVALTTDDHDSETEGFPREEFETELRHRNRRHGDPETAEQMDLYSIAAEYDIAGRSDMTKDELIDAILDCAEKLQNNPLALVDVTGQHEDTQAAKDTGDQQETTRETETTPSSETDQSEGTDDGQRLETMMSLLETHDDKWTDTDGDARYEVELPNGDTETARTKDDVRALLFKHY